MMRLPINGWNRCFLSLGAALIALGLISMIGFPPLLEHMIKRELQLREGNQAFYEWQKTRPLVMDIYFFNWTNPEDIYNLSTKPNLVEVGPYRVEFIREKVNITWNNENSTITYQNKLFYYYDEDSPGNYSDEITTFNVVAWAVAHQTKDSNIFKKEGAKFALLFSKLHITKTVRELLFDGYEDSLISIASSMSFLTGDDVPDKVGFFYGRNESIGLDGVQNVYVNLDEEYGTLKSWNYKNTSSFYEGSCSEIHGSAGEFYPRNRQPTHITYFATDLCRELKFNFERNHTVKGIFTYKYSADERTFDNGTIVEENKCYCRNKDQCLPSGVLDLSPCQMDLPVYTSLPHFYNGDPSYVTAVEGLRPEKDKHEFYFALEPMTDVASDIYMVPNLNVRSFKQTLGIISDTAARLQMNLLVQPVPGYSIFEGVPEIMFPIFWTENAVSLFDDYAAMVLLLINLPEINRVTSSTIIVLGAACVAYVILSVTCCSNDRFTKHKLEKEEVPLTCGA